MRLGAGVWTGISVTIIYFYASNMIVKSRTSTALPALAMIVAAVALFSSSTSAAEQKQCFGYTPMPSIVSYLGATLSYSTAERICCNNHHYAEYKGYLAAPEVDLFGRLDAGNETVFYDSVCGIPLFVAPRGRSFEEFKAESLKHGWPSFRPEEMIAENVIIHDDGRMESRCLTHLGHNLPEGGVDRYCIDLVCVAGSPLSVDDERANILSVLDASVIEHDEFDADAYSSSAAEFSGKYNKLPRIFTIVGSVVAAVIVAAGGMWYAFAWKKRKAVRTQIQVEDVPIEEDEDLFRLHESMSNLVPSPGEPFMVPMSDEQKKE